jgi:hypothetical protein
MWLYTFVFDHHITLLVCGVLVGLVVRENFQSRKISKSQLQKSDNQTIEKFSD